ncbi:DNA-binding protein [Clostridium beijerinckii]|uniref:DNA-binding protein n=1 Tax=Clostridium beijerinckii TaxID=1520 RepID=A0A0B5QBI2_CLOBE|nr:helix-turn-helix domain-containing protein [Clostridium beijerinckii]AJG98290.1 DNA-binding protein [Clostridium beijerinckii]
MISEANINENNAYSLLFREYSDVVNIKEMCEMLGGISTKTGYKILRENKINHFKIGRAYKIPKISILIYLKVIKESGIYSI